jgi:hypothetical protein
VLGDRAGGHPGDVFAEHAPDDLGLVGNDLQLLLALFEAVAIGRLPHAQTIFDAAGHAASHLLGEGLHEERTGQRVDADLHQRDDLAAVTALDDLDAVVLQCLEHGVEASAFAAEPVHALDDDGAEFPRSDIVHHLRVAGAAVQCAAGHLGIVINAHDGELLAPRLLAVLRLLVGEAARILQVGRVSIVNGASVISGRDGAAHHVVDQSQW